MKRNNIFKRKKQKFSKKLKHRLLIINYNRLQKLYKPINANDWSNACLQTKSLSLLTLLMGNKALSEDCLYLNI